VSASAKEAGIRVVVRLTPKGGRNALEGWQRDGSGKQMLKARVAGAAQDGQANAALVSLLAKHFGVPQGAVRIMRGGKGRVKQVTIQGDCAKLSSRLKAIGGPA
jgi:uncharacterized protein (TIGR00251 family)